MGVTLTQGAIAVSIHVPVTEVLCFCVRFGVLNLPFSIVALVAAGANTVN